jgi:hypothetical protein
MGTGLFSMRGLGASEYAENSNGSSYAPLIVVIVLVVVYNLIKSIKK